MLEIRHVRLSIALTFVMAIGNWGAQEPQWKGSIEDKDGIRVVRNPSLPLYGELKLELKEDLSLGREGSPQEMFFRIRGLAVDRSGTIFISDMGNQRVQVFDASGTFLRTIGRKGQGPGEFEQPTNIVIGGDAENLYVLDGPKIKVFGSDGKYILDVLSPKFPWDFTVDGAGSIYVKCSSSINLEEQTRDLARIEIVGQEPKTLVSYPFYYILQGTVEGGAVVGYSEREYDLCLASIDKTTLVYGFSRTYELNLIDGRGKPLLKVTKEGRPEPFGSAEAARLKKSRFFFRLPEHKPFFYSFLVDSERRLYVETSGPDHDIRPMKQFDVFGNDGRYLYRTLMPRGTYVIRDGFLYAHVTDEDSGAECIKRYRIRNWERIRSKRP